MNKYNYKYILGLIIGLILFGGIAYADILYESHLIHYDNSDSTLNAVNVKDALNELANKYTQNLHCPNGKVCVANNISIGDYVSYTPSKTSYTTDRNMTGYSSTQTINPSELNLWRVINLNSDGTVDIISKNVSSTSIYFSGPTGHSNFVGYLNTLAEQYENSNVAISSKSFGNYGQIQFLSNVRYFGTSDLLCGTGESCNPSESLGGGDLLYQRDCSLVNNVFGTLLATNPSGIAKAYFVASRNLSYSSNSDYSFDIRYIDNSGYLLLSKLTYQHGNSEDEYSFSASLRPIVTLRAGLSYSGTGSASDPKVIQ